MKNLAVWFLLIATAALLFVLIERINSALDARKERRTESDENTPPTRNWST